MVLNGVNNKGVIKVPVLRSGRIIMYLVVGVTEERLIICGLYTGLAV